MQIFDINNILFSVFGYPLSSVELLGTAFGLISVYLASRAHILTWATGIVNEVFLFVLFFQVQLYADMFLQVYFFVVTLYGWHSWKRKSVHNRVSQINRREKIVFAISIFAGTALFGYVFGNIHTYLPHYFREPAAYPLYDSSVMVLSIAATILLARKKIESWYLWIAVDCICTVLFFKKGVYFLTIEYLVFLGLASYGLFNWKKQLRND